MLSQCHLNLQYITTSCTGMTAHDVAIYSKFHQNRFKSLATAEGLKSGHSHCHGCWLHICLYYHTSGALCIFIHHKITTSEATYDTGLLVSATRRAEITSQRLSPRNSELFKAITNSSGVSIWPFGFNTYKQKYKSPEVKTKPQQLLRWVTIHMATIDMGWKVGGGAAEVGPHLTQCRLGLLCTKWHLDSSNHLATIHQHYNQTDRQADTQNNGPMVGWLEFNIPFQHKYGYIRDEHGSQHRANCYL